MTRGGILTLDTTGSFEVALSAVCAAWPGSDELGELILPRAALAMAICNRSIPGSDWKQDFMRVLAHWHPAPSDRVLH